MKRAREDIEVIAHRGASAYAPENTMAAFSKAVLMGARSIEFDVQETRDHQLVVIHDSDLKRVAGDRRALVNLDYAELANIDVGSWFRADFSDERAPLLEQVLDFLAGASQDVELQLEIKDGKRPYPGIERRVLEAMRHRPSWDGKVVVSSFNHDALLRVRQLAPRARLGYLVGSEARNAAIYEAACLGCESVNLSLRRASADWAKAAHAAGMRLLVYTVNSRKDLERSGRIETDGVFSDFPNLAAIQRDAAAGRT